MNRDKVLANIKKILDADNFPCAMMAGDELAPRPRLAVDLGQDDDGRDLHLVVDLLLEAEGREPNDRTQRPDDLNMLHFVAVLPFAVAEAHYADVARFVMLINATTEFPGFVFNEMGGLVCFRHMMISVSEAVDQQVVRKAIGLIAFCIEVFSKPLEQVATGARTIEQLLEEGIGEGG